VALFSAAAPATLDLLYPAEFRPAGPALQIIAFGYLGLTLLMMCVTIISSTGHPHLSLAFLLMSLITQVIFGFLLIPANPLRGAAWSTTIAALAGIAAAGLWLQLKYRVFLAPLSVLRVSASAGAIYLWALNFNQEGLGLILQDMILLIAYLMILYISRELTGEELSRFFVSLGWKKKTSP
jgi:O-antigen/teichoic acid export membrane protein